MAGLEKLAQAQHVVVKHRADAHAKASAEQQKREWREGLHATAIRALARIGEELIEQIQDNAPAAEIVVGPAPRRVLGRNEGQVFIAALNGAELALDQPQLSPATWTKPFTVVSESIISVTRPHPSRDGWRGRSHSLWFCDAQQENRFAWYELAFWQGAFGGHAPVEPTAASAQQTQMAFSTGIGGIAPAWPFTELDRSDLTEFVGRWLGWFGDAARDILQRPAMMPERPADGSWR